MSNFMLLVLTIILTTATLAWTSPTVHKNVALPQAIQRGKLPCAFGSSAAVYDERSKSIIIMGGQRYGPCIPGKRILRYDIETEAVTEIGQFPRAVEQGAAVILPSGEIFYFDGYIEEFEPAVYKFTVQNPIPEVVTSMPKHLVWPSAIYEPTHDAVFILGGYTPIWLDPYNADIYKYTPSLNEIEEYDVLETGRDSAASALVDGKIYLLGGTIKNHVTTDDIVKWDPTTRKEATFLTRHLPEDVRLASAVSSGTYIYVIGGRVAASSSKTSATRHQLTRFNTTALIGGVDEFTVENFPVALYAAATVLVPSLNRIYVVGGMDEFDGYSDKIYGIDLNF